MRVASRGPSLTGAREVRLCSPGAVRIHLLSLSLKLRRRYGAQCPAWRGAIARARGICAAAHTRWMWGVGVGTGARKSSHRGQVGTYISRSTKGRHGIGSRGCLAVQPSGYTIDALPTAQAAQHFLPLIITGERGEDGLATFLLAAQLVDFGSEIILGLAHGGFVNTLDILLGFASSAWDLTVALRKEVKVSRKLWENLEAPHRV